MHSILIANIFPSCSKVGDIFHLKFLKMHEFNIEKNNIEHNNVN